MLRRFEVKVILRIGQLGEKVSTGNVIKNYLRNLSEFYMSDSCETYSMFHTAFGDFLSNLKKTRLVSVR